MAPSWLIPSVSPPGMLEVLGERVLLNYITDRYEWNGLRFEVGREDLLYEAISKWQREREIINHQARQCAIVGTCGGIITSANPPEAPKTDKRKLKDLIAYYYKR